MHIPFSISAVGLTGALIFSQLTTTPGDAPTSTAGSTTEATTYAVDLTHSNILFKCKHLGVSYQWGRFDKFEGSFTLAEKETESKVSITVDAESVDTNSKDRDDHLRGPDFFNVKQFPEMTFESTEVEAKEGDVFTITGDLTLHGETKSITFDVEKVGEQETRMGQRAGFEGSFVIDRMDYGVKAYEKMLGHDVTMHFAIEGVKR